jgi:hypothetical protein
MRDLKQIALSELENDKLYLLALTEFDVCVPDLKLALGSEIKQFVLAENEYLFDEDDEDLTDVEKLSLIEETVETEIIPSAFILP